MPLPDAPKPITSNLYRQLNAARIQDMNPAKLAVPKNAIFLNDVSEDELRRLNLAGQASGQLSSSGPMINSAIVAETGEQTSAGTYFIFRPGTSSSLPLTGETGTLDGGDPQFQNGVWKLEAVSTTQTGSGWTGNFRLWVSVDGKKVYLTDLNNSSGSVPIFPETVGSIGVHMTGGCDLGIDIATVSGTLATVNISAYLIRVR
tara:strand:+ start:417 stop:1025 length:609 start_codon:yes stop_codon:yes gene_type:complete